jgi:hypothetical protein
MTNPEEHTMNPKPMTIADLKAALDEYDDTLEVFVDDIVGFVPPVLKPLHDTGDPAITALCFSTAHNEEIWADVARKQKQGS